MSEEEKQIMSKMIYCNLINGEQAIKFNRHIVEMQEEIEKLNYIIDKQDRDIVALSNGNRKLSNIIKEVREYIGLTDEDREYLGIYDVNGIGILNILDKVEENSK